MKTLNETPSQTAGPYVHIGCTPRAAGLRTQGSDLGSSMKTGPVHGTQVTICGTVFDGDGTALLDAMVEIWQADAAGIYPGADRPSDPNFTGWGRTAGDPETGAFQFDTVKPGQTAGFDGTPQAPHVTFWIVARGINVGLHTRMYFPDETAANARDPILCQIGDAARAATLIATAQAKNTYRFDIHLQGPRETVFLDI